LPICSNEFDEVVTCKILQQKMSNDELLSMIQPRLERAIKLTLHTTQGSLQKCHVYLTILQQIILQPNQPLALQTLYTHKQNLHRAINHRFLTKALVETMIEVELVTAFTLDLIKSQDGFIPEEPRLEFRFDWRDICQELEGQPIYLTQYGTEEWLMTKVAEVGFS
jgi:hypothetical protein